MAATLAAAPRRCQSQKHGPAPCQNTDLKTDMPRPAQVDPPHRQSVPSPGGGNGDCGCRQDRAALRPNHKTAARERRTREDDMDKPGTIDRRSLVIGATAAASALMAGPALAQEYPARAITVINPFPPGGAVRRRDAPVRRRPRADHQAGGGDRNQGGRGRRGRRAGRRQCQAGRLHPALPHHLALRLRRGRPPVRPPAEVHQCRFHPDRALRRRSLRAHRQRQAALREPEGVGRRRQEASRRDHLLLVGPLRRAAHSDGAVHEGGRRPAAAAPADARRRSRPDRVPRQQFAGAGLLRVGLPRPDQGRQGQARWRCSAPRAPRRCPTFRP